jgi:hypothetical protein
MRTGGLSKWLLRSISNPSSLFVKKCLSCRYAGGIGIKAVFGFSGSSSVSGLLWLFDKAA